jgi:hypothetical protein
MISEYECPECYRVAEWTDGQAVAAGDPVDEFWCQTCGAETLLELCRRVA